MWLAERFHWSLEYVDGLEVTEVEEIIDIVQSADAARLHEQHKAMKRR